MDRFTRNYLIGLAAIGALVLAWVLYEPPAVGRLNDALAANADIAGYPYRFRVISVENGVASMTSPRSAEFPAFRALELLYPALRGTAPDSAAMLEAQQEMARVQKLAADVVAASPEVNRVRWQLDEGWLRSRGAFVDGG